MVYIGIDPGRYGGYAAINVTESAIEAETHIWDDEKFIEWLKNKNGKPVNICLDAVHAFPGDNANGTRGATSTFNFGKSAGFIEGVIQTLGMPYQRVDPRKWKKEFSLDSDKQKSIDTCKHLFPGVSLLPSDRARKDSDGMAEALLMAEYARRTM